jgi:hypothetical protein
MWQIGHSAPKVRSVTANATADALAYDPWWQHDPHDARGPRTVVPTLRVGTNSATLCVASLDAERRDAGSHAERGNQRH